MLIYAKICKRVHRHELISDQNLDRRAEQFSF